MATKIVTKNSSTASAVPTASDLVQGELAVNVADKRLFTEDNTGTIVELGTNPSTIDINAGSIDGTAIGASSASTGAFTTLTATGLTVDTNTLYVDSTNNRVGIGTTSPISELHVADATGNTSITMEASDTGSNFLLFGDVTDSNADTNGGRIVYSHATEHMQFNTNATERMRIDSSGRVGIGTTSPITALHIADTHPTVYLETSGGGSTDAGFLQKYNNEVYLYNKESAGSLILGTNNAERMRIDSSGNLLVGTTTAGGQGGLTVYPNGSGTLAQVAWKRAANASANNAAAFFTGGSVVGTIAVGNTSTSYNTSSDQRLKENIADANDAGSKIDAIQVRKFDWKADGSHQDYGMIAQELVEVAPEAVTVPADSEEMMGVDYSKLVPMLIKEIQSLRNRVAQLEE